MAGGGGFFRPAGRGKDSAMRMAGQIAPPVFSFRLRRKEKTGRARSKREKPLGRNLTARVKFAQSTGAGLNQCQCELPVFCRLRLTAYRPLALCRSSKYHRGCFAGLTQGPQRLFPRFAHGRSRLGGILLLFPRKAPACAQAQEEGVDGGEFLRLFVSSRKIRFQ